MTHLTFSLSPLRRRFRWNAPISIALHAPGTDFLPTANAIKYLRDCLPESNLVRQFVTFHIYFSSKHVPKVVSYMREFAFINCAMTNVALSLIRFLNTTRCFSRPSIVATIRHSSTPHPGSCTSHKRNYFIPSMWAEILRVTPQWPTLS